MPRSRIATIALVVGASSSCAMAAYHFFLPWLFQWEARGAKQVAPAIRWGMYSINFFFSFLLLAGGLLTFVALRALRRGATPDRGVLIAMTSFWIINALYQLFIPMPLPAKLWTLHVGLIAYAIVTMFAYASALGALKAR
jgi:hypothetical protein